MYDLYQQFKKCEAVDLGFLVLEKKTEDKDITKFQFERSFIRGIKRRYNRWRLPKIGLKNHFEILTNAKTYFGDELMEFVGKPDLILINWVAGFVDIPIFLEYITKHKIPVLWRLADLNPFTGGCHYDYTCGKFKTGCGNCPQLVNPAIDDVSRQIFESKKKAFGDVPNNLLRFVALSDWGLAKAKQSPIISKFDLSTILNGVNTEIFSFKDKLACRAALGISSEDKVLLIVAEYLDIWYKGTQEAIDALERIKKDYPDICLVSVGKSQSIQCRFRHIPFGELSNRRLMAAVYGAADYFLFPSHYETFGRTFQEAMACGTPVIAYETGGVPHLVEHGINGYITKDKNAESLYETIFEALGDYDDLELISERAADRAKEYSLEKQAGNYIQLSAQMTNGTA